MKTSGEFRMGNSRSQSGSRPWTDDVQFPLHMHNLVNLKRLAARAIVGMARTGAAGSNGSGDYFMAFSTAPELRIRPGDQNKSRQVTVLGNEAMSPLFLAAIEATEEAIYNSLLKATTVTGNTRSGNLLTLTRSSTSTLGGRLSGR